MKKTLPALGLTISVAVTLILTHEGMAQWPTGLEVAETPHNLTRPAASTDPDMVGLIENYAEVCTYCHAPHGGNIDNALWNRRTPTGPFRMFNGGTDMIMDPQPTGNSLACLSCHDGTMGLDDIVDLPNTYTGPGPAGTAIDECENCHKGGNPPGGLDWEGVWFDTDLRNQHPISITYDTTLDPGFHPAAAVEAAGLKLFDGKVQCMTCHEPHTQRFRPFLRLDDTGGNLCLTCHISPPGETTAHFW